MTSGVPGKERDPVFEAALTRASEENGLQPWYRDLVRPLFNMPDTQWPRCCGAGCEPCSEQLIRVARRVRELLATEREQPGSS